MLARGDYTFFEYSHDGININIHIKMKRRLF